MLWDNGELSLYHCASAREIQYNHAHKVTTVCSSTEITIKGDEGKELGVESLEKLYNDCTSYNAWVGSLRV